MSGETQPHAARHLFDEGLIDEVETRVQQALDADPPSPPGVLDFLPRKLRHLTSVIEELAPGSRREFTFAIFDRLSSTKYLSFVWLSASMLGGIDLELSADDVRILLSMDATKGDDDSGRHLLPIVVALRVVERLLTTDANIGRGLGRDVAELLESWNPSVYLAPSGGHTWVGRYRDVARQLAELPPAGPPELGPLVAEDAFALAAIAQLGDDVATWPAGLHGLLQHLATARQSAPSPRWLARCRSYLDETPSLAEDVRRLLEAACRVQPVSFMTDHGRHVRLLSSFNDDLVRGLVWATSLIDEPWLPLLTEVASRCLKGAYGRTARSTEVAGEKVPYACFWALGANGSDAAVAALSRLRHATTNRTVQKRIDKVLDEIAAERGITAFDLVETAISDWGLNEDGEVVIDIRGTAISFRLDNELQVATTWKAVGVADSTPDDSEVIAETEAFASELQAAARGERDRLETYLWSGRDWIVEDFQQRFVSHHLIGPIARRLLWTCRSLTGETTTGLPVGPWRLRTPSGEVPLAPEGVITLWHPATASAEEIAALRALVQVAGVAQPFGQAWREGFAPGASEDSGLYSTRFAGHIVRAPQLYTLLRQRGWSGGYVTDLWEGGERSTAVRTFSAVGVKAEWSVASLDWERERERVDLCSTDRLLFLPVGEEEAAPIPIAAVPPRVLSEAMRDLSLFVSVCTVANDRIWLERFAGEPRLHHYWEWIAHGGLEETLATRRDVLAVLYGETQAGDQFELTERDLIVRGSLGTYFVDLATGNVRMEPPGKWLSIGTRTPKEFKDRRFAWYGGTPVDDDEILRRIMYRSGMLAADDRVKDAKLRRQLRGD